MLFLILLALSGCLSEEARFKRLVVKIQQSFLQRDYDGAYRTLLATGRYSNRWAQYLVGHLLVDGLEELAYPSPFDASHVETGLRPADWYLPEIQYVLPFEERHREAIVWLRRSAEGGVPNAAEDLALIYQLGLGSIAKDAALTDCFREADHLWRRKLDWKRQLDICLAMEREKGYRKQP